MRDLDLTTLRLFVAVCETRNMARAGEQENIVASAISKRLAQLEDTVGTVLLERGRRGVIPTPAGDIVLAHARAMLAAADRVARDMADYGSGIRGQVRLLATVSSMAESLPDDIAAFLNRPEHRDIRVTMEESMSSDIVRALREGSAPLGICWDAADLEGFETRPYRADHLAVAVHEAHPLAPREHCRFEDTLEFDHVGLPAQTAVHTMLARYAAILGHTIKYRAVVSTFDASLRCVRAGLGLAIVPGEIAEPFIPTFGLRVVPLSDDWARRRFTVCFRNLESLSPAARLLVEHLAACDATAAIEPTTPARQKKTTRKTTSAS
ncbi:DNA-binding transcriptional LysR family regulator [Ralstonia sp. GP73]|jgi:DNA-binding transcriptional LysR family regulator|uniref:HTH-type transcriptional regulator BenM n=2 Tax=Ralstonia TaxID=48736 RepID=A0AAD2BSR7_9RALS|nr:MULTISPECIES: LysR family transcriptional regulator [Ralstonia]MBT2176883.1 LysR family transcriptional regulator [Ralstonia pickettii]MDH6642186.1 DNA-binding transcriptional LysR family regulator [Ralstonia sp. GP73]OCS50767.1 LysR family transcriptional regulator [Ralstonia pickettii]CAJ0708752.1 HTH-type transcriptional regulator BenM [Ralstonia sp. LMG 18095]CAJ0796024.1 HTH-type transcriptional regulator BenM [Ralstonia sp. LMG 18095]